jgi:hypothetical protein
MRKLALFFSLTRAAYTVDLCRIGIFQQCIHPKVIPSYGNFAKTQLKDEPTAEFAL